MTDKIKKYVSKRLIELPVIVEIGSHYGEDSIDFLKVMNPICVHCFEPDPRNIFVFKKYINDRRIHLWEFAVSNFDDELVDFHQSYKSEFSSHMFDKYYWIDKKEYVDIKINASGASSLKKGHPLLDEGDTIKVRTIRIDTWAKLNDITNIDFLWVDVQGAEREVVEGLGELSKRIKYVWIEFGEDKYEGYMDRKETISLFYSIDFNLDKSISDKGNKGNLLFSRR